jgi:hypothetical protein
MLSGRTKDRKFDQILNTDHPGKKLFDPSPTEVQPHLPKSLHETEILSAIPRRRRVGCFMG